MQYPRVVRIIVSVCRAIQIPIALITLGLTASLIPTFTSIEKSCVNSIEGIDCRRIDETVGGLRFSIATSVIAMVDVAVGIAALWISDLPNWLAVIVITMDSMAAGFYLGSGSTIAARLNGELCDAGPSDPQFACGRLFTDMGFFFVGAATCYALVACFWASRAKRCRSYSAEVVDGHALQNPFADPVGTEPESRNQNGLGKRRSWSQLS